jgi:hypothetical protein
VNQRGREGRLGPALLVALLVAALVTGILVYRARTSNLALEVPKIDRLLGTNADGKLPVRFEFFVRFDEPDALVEIVGSGDTSVRTLADDVELNAEERIGCAWEGLDDDGEPVPPGNYRLRVVLPDQDRDMVFPQRIRVRRAQPAKVVVAVPRQPCERKPGGEPLL